MEEIDWDALEAAEENAPAEPAGEEDILLAYGTDADAGAEAEDENGDYGMGDGPEGPDDEFEDQPEFMVSFLQREQLSRGDLAMGTRVGGRLGKLQQIVQRQTVSREILYLAKLRSELMRDFNFEKAQHYSTMVTQVPRFWLKNAAAMARTLYMMDSLADKEVTSASLSKFCTPDIPKEDLWRYYRLLKKYI